LEKSGAHSEQLIVNTFSLDMVPLAQWSALELLLLRNQPIKTVNMLMRVGLEDGESPLTRALKVSLM